MRPRATVLTVLLALALPAGADARVQQVSARASALSPGGCPGAPIRPDRVITGQFSRALQGSYVMVPFDVPAGTTAVRVKYCFDQPDLPTSSTPVFSIRHTLDLGLYGPRRSGSRVWGMREFRGWGGSSHPDVTVSPEGFSTEAQYTADPRVNPRGKTTRAFLPGPIRPGTWAAELGVAAVASQAEGDADGKVGWRVEVELARNPAYADQPYRPARYDRRPARRKPGWYAGDMHVHAEHSAYGDATMREALDYAFSERGADLDFVTLSDYVSGSAWGEIGRVQPRYPGKLIERSAEVITYRGHLNNQGTARVADYRTGPVLERRPNGALATLRGSRPPRDEFDRIRRAGGYTQINHPTIFPSSVPGFGNFCRGCSWEYSGAETDYSKVDAIEVATGPSGAPTEPGVGPNPFTLTAIDFYEAALATGSKIAAVGVSDSHNAGRTPNAVTQAPIGEATTVVRAQQLSGPAVECAVEAGHTYVKVTGKGAPDLRLSAGAPGVRGRAIMGDTLRGGRASFAARVLGGSGTQLSVVKNGQTVSTVPVSGNDFTHRFAASGPGRYRLQLGRGSAIEALTTPIWVEAGRPRLVTRDCSPLRVRGIVAKRVRVRRGRLAVRCRASGGGLRSCSVEVVARRRKRGKVVRRVVGRGRVAMKGGTRRVRVRLTRWGRRFVRRHRGGRRMRFAFVARDGEGGRARAVKRARLRLRRRR